MHNEEKEKLYESMGMIILEEKAGCTIAVDVDLFDKKAEEILQNCPPEKIGKTFKQLILEDKEDVMGWRKYIPKIS